MSKRKTVESNAGPCPKRDGEGHVFQNPRNVPPWWCLYCERLAIVPPDPRYVPRGPTRTDSSQPAGITADAPATPADEAPGETNPNTETTNERS